MWNVSASGRVTSWAESCKRSTLMRLAPVAQGIERVPPEHEVAGSIPAGRTSSRARTALASDSRRGEMSGLSSRVRSLVFEHEKARDAVNAHMKPDVALITSKG